MENIFNKDNNNEKVIDNKVNDNDDKSLKAKKQIIDNLKSINYEKREDDIKENNVENECDLSKGETKPLKQIALYIHIPFCQRKCNYCSFISFCNKMEKIDLYLDCLIKEMQLRTQSTCQLKSIYIGGGTPSILNENQIEKLFNAIYDNFKIAKNAEITIEVNPNSVTKEKLQTYKKCGINRISVGIQSLSNKQLKVLGRLHNKQKAIETLKLITECGFHNVNADLIFGLKGTNTLKMNLWINKIRHYVTHFSIYSLMIEENTPFYDAYKNNKLKVLNENQSAKVYKKIVKTLSKNGFNRYEVSNFAKCGYESKHNQTYWELSDYLGLGIASHSFIDNQRIANTEDFDMYINAINENKLPNQIEWIDNDKLKEEFIMLSLRESKGIDLQKYKHKFGSDLQETKKKEIQLLKTLNLIKIENNHLFATDNGFLVLNQIILKLI